MALSTLRVVVALGRRWSVFRPLAHRLADRVAQSPAPVRVSGRLASRVRIELDLRDHAHRHIFIHGELDAGTTMLFRRTLAPGDVVLDIGANAGYYSLLAAELGAIVHAFEPQARLAEMLRDSADEHVTVVEAACGAAAGELQLFESMDPAFGGMASLVPGRYTISETAGTTVAVIQLDTYCDQHALNPRLIKIDVEGFELEVLEGLRTTLARARPLVVCEVAFGGGRERAVFDLFDEANYEPRSIAEAGDLVTFADSPRGEANVDIFFVPRDRDIVLA